MACEFLDGNECTVYEARPANCERFPHLLRGAWSLESRMWAFANRATYCPIVYNWMETVKKLTKFTPKKSKTGTARSPLFPSQHPFGGVGASQ